MADILININRYFSYQKYVEEWQTSSISFVSCRIFKATIKICKYDKIIMPLNEQTCKTQKIHVPSQ